MPVILVDRSIIGPCNAWEVEIFAVMCNISN